MTGHRHGNDDIANARNAPASAPMSGFAVLRHVAKAKMRYAGIRAGLEVTALASRAPLFSGLGGRGLVFTLHHVRPAGDEPDFAPNAHLSVTPSFLEEAIGVARESGLVPVHLHDLPALLSDQADDRKFVAFTLDDGYRNNAEHAAPVFRRFGVPYTIFVCAGFTERKRTIWWETAAALLGAVDTLTFDFGAGPERLSVVTYRQKAAAFARLVSFVQTLEEDEAVARIDDVARAAGIDPMAIVEALVMDEGELRWLAEDPLVHFGAHTLTHVNLRRVGTDRLKEETLSSAHAVERYVGAWPRSFAYPYGSPSAAAEREAKATVEAGFDVAVTTQPGVLTAQSFDRPALLPRVSLNGLFQKPRHVRALISGLPFKLPA